MILISLMGLAATAADLEIKCPLGTKQIRDCKVKDSKSSLVEYFLICAHSMVENKNLYIQAEYTLALNGVLNRGSFPKIVTTNMKKSSVENDINLFQIGSTFDFIKVNGNINLNKDLRKGRIDVVFANTHTKSTVTCK